MPLTSHREEPASFVFFSYAPSRAGAFSGVHATGEKVDMCRHYPVRTGAPSPVVSPGGGEVRQPWLGSSVRETFSDVAARSADMVFERRR